MDVALVAAACFAGLAAQHIVYRSIIARLIELQGAERERNAIERQTLLNRIERPGSAHHLPPTDLAPSEDEMKAGDIDPADEDSGEYALVGTVEGEPDGR